MQSRLEKIAEGIIASVEALENWDKVELSSWELALPSEGVRCVDELTTLERTLVKTLHRVRSGLNVLSPVNRLPADVLKHIFEHLAPSGLYNDSCTTLSPSPDQPTSSTPSPQLVLYKWQQITTICRRWREVATSCPTLWATVVIGPRHTPNKIVEMQLRYSGNAPLSLHLHSNNAPPEMAQCIPYQWGAGTIRALIPRLKELHVRVARADQPAVLAQLTEPAPLLERLTVCAENWPHKHVGALGAAEVLPTLFQDQVPRLRCLTIAGLTSWPGNAFRGLTRLCVRNCHPPQTGPPMHTLLPSPSPVPCADLVRVLRDCPALEELVVQETLPPRDGSTLPLEMKVVLPRLRLLVLEYATMDTTSVSTLLTMLVVPARCAIYLNNNVQNNKPADAGTLARLCASPALDNLRAHLQGITRLYLYTIPGLPWFHNLLGCGASGLYVKTNVIFGGLPPLAGTQPRAHNGHILDLPTAPEHARLYAAMAVAELWVDVHASIRATAAQWRALYAVLPLVARLVIVARCDWGEPVWECLEVLRRPDGDGGAMCLPGLVDLHVVVCNGPMPGSLASVVEAVRSEREAIGVPLQRLTKRVVPSAGQARDDGEASGVSAEDIAFDLRPFKGLTPLDDVNGADFWPRELVGDRPELWSVPLV